MAAALERRQALLQSVARGVVGARVLVAVMDADLVLLIGGGQVDGLDHGAGGALYAASKAGALALFDSLAAEVKQYNINVNSVLPSIIDTAANRKAIDTLCRYLHEQGFTSRLTRTENLFAPMATQ